MIDDVVIVSPGAVPRLEAMIEAAVQLEGTARPDLVLTRTDSTGWSDAKGNSVSFQPIRTRPGDSRIHVAFDGERMAVHMPLDRLPWAEGTRPTLPEITALLRALAAGRPRSDSDPIEVLARAVAATMSFDPPEPERISAPTRPPRPFLTVVSPRLGRSGAHLRWNDLGTMVDDERWMPSSALHARLATLPVELGVVQNDDRMQAYPRAVQMPIPDRSADPMEILRGLAEAGLADDERMITP